MDDHKVKAILDWEPPKSVPALRSFLGLASYYRKCRNPSFGLATKAKGIARVRAKRKPES